MNKIECQHCWSLEPHSLSKAVYLKMRILLSQQLLSKFLQVTDVYPPIANIVCYSLSTGNWITSSRTRSWIIFSLKTIFLLPSPLVECRTLSSKWETRYYNLAEKWLTQSMDAPCWNYLQVIILLLTRVTAVSLYDSGFKKRKEKRRRRADLKFWIGGDRIVDNVIEVLTDKIFPAWGSSHLKGLR